MTTEEAIRHIRDILAENNSIKPSMVVFELEKEALYMAIKALEKEPILDKIREQIELEKLGYPPSAGYYKAIMKVLQIIDEYKKDKEDNK